MLYEQDFIVETLDQNLPANLPEALALLCRGHLLSFEGLAAHQRHAWFLFLCQLATLALIHAGEDTAAEEDEAWAALDDAEAWRQRLAALTPGCADTAWSLVVDDPAQPAFMQPPIRQALDRYEVIGRTPDEIDLLVTAKAHDLKPARAGRAGARHWIFALVSLQTQQGYSGRGNFGIARMNGGFASRPMLMLTPSQDLPKRFRRGTQAALAARRKALDQDYSLFRDNGTALLWLEPWDSETSLKLGALDPLFVEICRRLRLQRRDPGGSILALGRPSDVPRVEAKAAKGNLGDAWRVPPSPLAAAASIIAAYTASSRPTTSTNPKP
jgi:CRISPR system Cascade subunit CasA